MAAETILITGASSGLGEALALHYAEHSATLFLSGRNSARLEAVAFACRAKGGRVHTRVLDVTDQKCMAAWIAECDGLRPLDLVIANAGISAGTGGGGEEEDQTRQMFDVNITGVVNTIWPAIAAMRQRKRGQIALMASLASFRGMPGAPGYCASKAAVRVWGEGLRGWLAEDGIGVSVICPGFVESRMTAANDFTMPFLMNAPKAARIMAEGLARNQGRIAFPWPMLAASWLVGALPDAVADWIGRKMPAKGK